MQDEAKIGQNKKEVYRESKEKQNFWSNSEYELQ